MVPAGDVSRTADTLLPHLQTGSLRARALAGCSGFAFPGRFRLFCLAASSLRFVLNRRARFDTRFHAVSFTRSFVGALLSPNLTMPTTPCLRFLLLVVPHYRLMPCLLLPALFYISSQHQCPVFKQLCPLFPIHLLTPTCVPHYLPHSMVLPANANFRLVFMPFLILPQRDLPCPCNPLLLLAL